MYTVEARNVNEAFHKGLDLLLDEGQHVAPRGAKTLEVPGPVATVYRRPWERVLFNQSRDANPFFHLFESLWIIAGGRDARWLSFFNSRMLNYSDDGETFHGAYGYRLRREQGFDQINEVLDLLRADPDSRRAVLQIWDAKKDLNWASRDIPCNDLVFLKVRDGALHITVSCRSNDLVWGAYGANAVQFSMLQEYLAARLGVRVGTYTQVSDSFHAYVEGDPGAVFKRIINSPQMEDPERDDPYALGEVGTLPIAQTDPAAFDIDLTAWFSDPYRRDADYRNPFFHHTAIPAYRAWAEYKLNDNLDRAVNEAMRVQSPDWRRAMIEWIERRKRRRNAKGGV